MFFILFKKWCGTYDCAAWLNRTPPEEMHANRCAGTRGRRLKNKDMTADIETRNRSPRGTRHGAELCPAVHVRYPHTRSCMRGTGKIRQLLRINSKEIL